MTVREAIKWGLEELHKAGISSPQADVEQILMHILKCSRKDILVKIDRKLSPEELKAFRDHISRRSQREPLQYITGTVEFYGLQFKIEKGVFIPRPETEFLVETILESEPIRYKDQEKIEMIDLCTGSGCVAIAVAAKVKNIFIKAVDISRNAIKLAKYNAMLHKVEDRIEFIVGDLFSPLDRRKYKEQIDIISVNPPYVSSVEMEYLQPEIRQHEPLKALYGGPHGLDFYRRIIHEAYLYLRSGGILVMEAGYRQSQDIEILIQQTSKYTNISWKYDLAGIKRIIKVQKR